MGGETRGTEDPSWAQYNRVTRSSLKIVRGEARFDRSRRIPVYVCIVGTYSTFYGLHFFPFILSRPPPVPAAPVIRRTWRDYDVSCCGVATARRRPDVKVSSRAASPLLYTRGVSGRNARISSSKRYCSWQPQETGGSRYIRIVKNHDSHRFIKGVKNPVSLVAYISVWS